MKQESSCARFAVLAAATASSSTGRRGVLLRVAACSGLPLAVYSLFRVFVLHAGGPAIASLSEIALKGPVSVAKYIWWTIHAPPMSMERSTEFLTLTFGSSTYVLAWLTILAVAVLSFAFRRSVPLVMCGIVGAFARCFLLRSCFLSTNRLRNDMPTPHRSESPLPWLHWLRGCHAGRPSPRYLSG